MSTRTEWTAAGRYPARTGVWTAFACAIAGLVVGCFQEDKAPVDVVPGPAGLQPQPAVVSPNWFFKEAQAKAASQVADREAARLDPSASMARVEELEDRAASLLRSMGLQLPPGITQSVPSSFERGPRVAEVKPDGPSKEPPNRVTQVTPKVTESRPPTPEQPVTAGTEPVAKPRNAPTTWELKAAQDQITRLTAAADELLIRGNPDSYDHAAAADWHLDHLREMAKRLGLPPDFIPENEFRLLDRERLEPIRERCEAQLARFKKAAASSPNGAYSNAIADTEAKLRQVRLALDQNPIDLQAKFDELDSPRKITQEYLDWLNQRQSAQSTEIEARRGNLLQKALALDGSDVAVRQKLAAIDRSAAIDGRILATNHGEWAVERARGFSPRSDIANLGTSGTVKEMIVSRWSDPERALRYEAALMSHWRELADLPDGPLPEALRESAPDWMVSQMTDGHLVEVERLADDALAHTRKIKEAGLAPLFEKANTYDIKILEAERDAIRREIDYRSTHDGQPRFSPVELSKLVAPARAVIERQAGQSVEDVLKTSDGKRELWASSRRYLERVALAPVRIVETMNRVALDGYREQVDGYAKIAEEYKQLRVEYTKRGLLPEEAALLTRHLGEMEKSLAAQETEIRKNLTAAIDDPASYTELRELWSKMDVASRDAKEAPKAPETAAVKKGLFLLDLVLINERPDGWPKRPGSPPTEPPPGQPITDPNRPIKSPPGSGHGVADNADSGKPGRNGKLSGGDGSDLLGGVGPEPGDPDKPRGGGGGAAAVVERKKSAASPFGDPILARERNSFEQAKAYALTLVKALNDPVTARAGDASKPYVLIESDPTGQVRQASLGERPELKGWLVKKGPTGIADIEDTPKPVSFDAIDRLESIRIIPGGVALGKEAVVDGDWKAGGLIYVAKDKRAYLVRSSGERVELPEVAPEVLKTCFLFARSEDPVAISIGYTGERINPLTSQVASQVLLHPNLRDTQVGRDIIEADRLPWSLREDKLPNGKPNPVLATMQPLVNKAGSSEEKLPLEFFLKRMAEIADLEQAPSTDRNRRFQEIIVKLLREGGTRVDLMLRSIAESNANAKDYFRTFVHLENADYLDSVREQARKELEQEIDKLIAEGKTLDDVKKQEAFDRIKTADLETLIGQEGMKKLAAQQASLRGLFDGLPADHESALRSLLIEFVSSMTNVPWRYVQCTALSLMSSPFGADKTLREVAPAVLQLMASSHLSLLTDSEVRVRPSRAQAATETRLRIRYVHAELKPKDEGLERSDDVAEAAEAGETGTRLISVIEASYEPLKRTREYAFWIALMRWAIQEKNLGWLDLADLAGVDHRKVPTPDYLLSGPQQEMERVARERFGLAIQEK